METLITELFPFPKGRLTALIGKNGAGKTTLIRRLLAKAPPTALAATAAYVPQEHKFPPSLLLRDLLRLAYLGRAGLFGKLPDRRSPEIEASLERFGLSALADRPLQTLSTGERQKAFLARALLQRPRVLLLDEPTNHLDPGAVASFWRHLITEKERLKCDVLVSTHDLRFVKNHAEWVHALENGRTVFDGEVARFWNEKWEERIFGFLNG